MFDQLVNHANPSVRFWALTELDGLPLTAPEVQAARTRIPMMPAVRAILDAQYPQGYWMHPGLGIAPRYRATVWQVLFLAQFGVGRLDAVDRALDVLWAQNLDQRSPRTMGGFRMRRDGGPSLALTGALLWAWGQMGYAGDARLRSVWAWARETCAQRRGALSLKTATWMLRAAGVWQEHALGTAEGPQRRYARSDVILNVVEGSDVGAWCADVLLKALTRAEGCPLPAYLYFPVADYCGWLLALEALVEGGWGQKVPPRYLKWLADKRGADGFWPLERVPGRLWWDPGSSGTSNPWITIRALKVLEGVD